MVASGPWLVAKKTDPSDWTPEARLVIVLDPADNQADSKRPVGSDAKCVRVRSVEWFGLLLKKEKKWPSTLDGLERGH